MKCCAAVLLLLPLSCFAVDGVYEINQLCVDSGCFNGDTPGWPVTLAQNGSYRLTSNLDVSGASDAGNITAIEITVHSVSLDLNGFSIQGPQLSGISGTGVGIHGIIQSNAIGTSIANGHVTAMGGSGIICADNCRIDKVTATFNGMHGIMMLGRGLLTNSASSNNVEIGVSTNGVVKNCVISNNGSTGLLAFGTSMMEGSQVIENANLGVECFGCSLINNVISNNGSGISFHGNESFGGNKLSGNAGGDTNVPMFQTAPNNCSGVACP